ncbi:MAG: hypothetical protein MJ252_13090 [archaeon]|nr:hypothetical protein [archaeon]
MESTPSSGNTKQKLTNFDNSTQKEKYINQKMCNQLIGMGFSVNVSEKACYYTHNITVDMALEWIQNHQEDIDFEEKLEINENDLQNYSEDVEEEMELTMKAMEIKKEMKELHEQKEKVLKEEQIKIKAKNEKEKEEAKYKEEEEIVRQIRQKEGNRNNDETKRKKLFDQINKEKEKIFGKNFDSFISEQQNKEYSKEDKILYYINSIKTIHPPNKEGEKLKNCYALIKSALKKIIENINEEKFRKLKMTNPNVQERIGSIPYAIKCLSELGFIEEGEFMICRRVNEDLFIKIIKVLEKELEDL